LLGFVALAGRLAMEDPELLAACFAAGASRSEIELAGGAEGVPLI